MQILNLDQSTADLMARGLMAVADAPHTGEALFLSSTLYRGEKGAEDAWLQSLETTRAPEPNELASAIPCGRARAFFLDLARGIAYSDGIVTAHDLLQAPGGHLEVLGALQPHAVAGCRPFGLLLLRGTARFLCGLGLFRPVAGPWKPSGMNSGHKPVHVPPSRSRQRQQAHLNRVSISLKMAAMLCVRRSTRWKASPLRSMLRHRR